MPLQHETYQESLFVQITMLVAEFMHGHFRHTIAVTDRLSGRGLHKATTW